MVHVKVVQNQKIEKFLYHLCPDTMILLAGKDVSNETKFSSESKHFCLTPNKLRPHNIKTSN